MPLMEAFEQGARYVFVPERAKKAQLSAVALLTDGRAMLEISAPTAAALTRQTRALEKILGKPQRSLAVPETGATRLLYAKGGEAMLQKLCRAGLITRDDAEHALSQYDRLEMKKPKTGGMPAGAFARQNNARISA